MKAVALWLWAIAVAVTIIGFLFSMSTRTATIVGSTSTLETNAVTSETIPAIALSASAMPEEEPSRRPRYSSSATSVRIMFLGDSITQGAAAGGSPRYRLPRNGTCSHRFSFLNRLDELLASKNSSIKRIVTVGPFSESLGGPTPPSCCSDRLADSTSGAHECMQQYGRHAAVYGVHTSHFFIENNDVFLHILRDRVKKFFGSKSAKRIVVHGEASEALTAPGGGNALRRWMRVYAPEVIVMLLGTNDYYYGLSPHMAMGNVLPTMMSTMLTSREKKPIDGIESMPLTFVISTLLPRSGLDVNPFNDVLLAIRACKRGGVRALCLSCVESTLHSATQLTERVTQLPSTSWYDVPVNISFVSRGWTLWCSPDVFVVHGGNVSIMDNSTRFMFDGLHPHGFGDVVLGAHLAEESVREGVWDP